jgi:hypothetical protein
MRKRFLSYGSKNRNTHHTVLKTKTPTMGDNKLDSSGVSPVDREEVERRAAHERYLEALLEVEERYTAHECYLKAILEEEERRSANKRYLEALPPQEELNEEEERCAANERYLEALPDPQQEQQKRDDAGIGRKRCV